MPVACHACGDMIYQFDRNPRDPEQYCYPCWKRVCARQVGTTGPYHCPMCQQLRFDYMYFVVAERFNVCRWCLENY